MKIELNFKHRKGRITIDWNDIVDLQEMEEGTQICIRNPLNVISVRESYSDIIKALPRHIKPKKVK